MTQSLVCYDYGSGGVWLYVEAEDRAALLKRYPALIIVDEKPPWLSPEEEAKLRAKIGDPWWDAWLAALPGSDEG